MSGPKALQVAPVDVKRALRLLASSGLVDETRAIRREGPAGALVPALDSPGLADVARALNAKIVVDNWPASTAHPPHPRARAALSVYRPRNGHHVDVWSFVHVATCAGLTFLLGPVVAFVVALVWEPIEVLVLSPMLARRGIDFGHESLANSLSDVAFNSVGILAAWLGMTALGWSAVFL